VGSGQHRRGLPVAVPGRALAVDRIDHAVVVPERPADVGDRGEDGGSQLRLPGSLGPLCRPRAVAPLASLGPSARDRADLLAVRHGRHPERAPRYAELCLRALRGVLRRHRGRPREPRPRRPSLWLRAGGGCLRDHLHRVSDGGLDNWRRLHREGTLALPVILAGGDGAHDLASARLARRGRDAGLAVDL